MHDVLRWASLIAWLLTAGGGFVLLAIWVQRGGMQQPREGSRIRPPLILGHFALAAAGLVLWIVYLVTDSGALGWIAFVLLLLVAALGWTMFAIWYRRRQAAGATRDAAAGSEVAAEQHFPVPIVAAHGVLAVTTLLLVFLTVLGVG